VAVLIVVLLVLIGAVLQIGRGESAPPADTLVVAQTEDFPSIDPALAQAPEAWQLEYATCAKLVDYPPVEGYRGTRLVPEIAASLPEISSDRLTYVFRIRHGWRFDDGTRVTARSFARALARARSPRLVSPAGPYLREVVSWRAVGDTLTIHLRQPAPDFVQRLTLPYFCAVPTWAPDEQDDTLPSAGPMYVADYHPGRALTLKRNPYYRGPHRARVARVLYEFGAYPSEILLQLERGQVDYGQITNSGFASLSRDLSASGRHLFVAQQPLVAYLALNTERPLFHHNPQLRRAVNYALDRPQLARLFGPSGAVPADEYLPPGFPGFVQQHVYPLKGPDLATARRLARGHLRGGHATFLACGALDCQERALAVAAQLGRIGLHVRVRTSPGFGSTTLSTVRGTHFDIADVITRPDYGDPYALVDKLLDGRVIRSVGNTNLSYFDDPRFDHSIDHAQRLTGVARDRAYGTLGVAVARAEAPLAAYAVLNARVFVSSRVGCLTYQPVYGVDLAGACLKGG
jgi:peptide/nickel transport system substrate-binding protein